MHYTAPSAKGQAAVSNRRRVFRQQKRVWQLYALFLLPLAHLIIFSYVPMYGVQIAFRDYVANLGIVNSPWVGLKHFDKFFSSYMFERVLTNTIRISVVGLIAGFPLPIVFAVMLNEMRHPRLKKVVQTVTYAPYFISTVVLCGMVLQFLDTRSGIINNIIDAMGFERQNFMGNASAFTSIYVISGLWQGTGYSAVVYLAALSSVDMEQYEAAVIDGASRLQKIIHVDLPSIAPTIVILLILDVGQIMNVGFEKAYLLQNQLNVEKSELISTYVYKVGLLQVQYSFSAAVGLFNSVINFILLITANAVAGKLGETSLW